MFVHRRDSAQQGLQIGKNVIIRDVHLSVIVKAYDILSKTEIQILIGYYRKEKVKNGNINQRSDSKFNKSKT